MKRIGVIGIVVKGDRSVAIEIQKILSDFADIILGRMGMPHKEHNLSTISVILEGSNERITALTGRLGRLENVFIKSALTSVEVE